MQVPGSQSLANCHQKCQCPRATHRFDANSDGEEGCGYSECEDAMGPGAMIIVPGQHVMLMLVDPNPQAEVGKH
jgi:hypothetical protein